MFQHWPRPLSFGSVLPPLKVPRSQLREPRFFRAVELTFSFTNHWISWALEVNGLGVGLQAALPNWRDTTAAATVFPLATRFLRPKKNRGPQAGAPPAFPAK